eukprot:TRINITY_DN98718_c0_g1_i1.p1 TRINITY_DN98718_c0_g1~~TRINITY_DN98718_c0_g1_i1.p1  ORF type:complete len:240 (-),score=34.12 TRINITY_DN98718_c0_g1_i1:182-880(-)
MSFWEKGEEVLQATQDLTSGAGCVFVKGLTQQQVNLLKQKIAAKEALVQKHGNFSLNVNDNVLTVICLKPGIKSCVDPLADLLCFVALEETLAECPSAGGVDVDVIVSNSTIDGFVGTLFHTGNGVIDKFLDSAFKFSSRKLLLKVLLSIFRRFKQEDYDVYRVEEKDITGAGDYNFANDAEASTFITEWCSYYNSPSTSSTVTPAASVASSLAKTDGVQQALVETLQKLLQ